MLNNTFAGDTLENTTYKWYYDEGHSRILPYEDTLSWTFTNETDEDRITHIILESRLEIPDGGICYNRYTDSITIWAVPIVSFDVAPLEQEYPHSIVYIENNCSSNFDEYSWVFGNGDARIDTFYRSYFEYNYYDNGWGTYTITLTVENESCSDSAAVEIIITAPYPSSNFNGSQTDCEYNPFKLDANVLYVEDGRSEYRWNIYDDLNKTNLIAQFTEEEHIWEGVAPGIYYADLYATAEGSGWLFHYIRTDTIEVFPAPVADFTVAPTEVMLPDQPISCVNLSTDAVRYEWNFGDMCGDTACVSYEFAPVHFYTEPSGNNPYCVTLRAWSSDNCYDFNDNCDYMITVNPEGELIFPNAFTPSLTGPSGGVAVDDYEHLNDVFIASVREGISELDYKMEIFNRWGELIYESESVNIGWDGYINAKLAPQDVYIYKVTGRFNNGKPFKYIGNVTLLR